MYLPKHFKVEDEAEIFAFIDANSFGQLISQQQGRSIASHLPFLLAADHSRLLCHVARPNPQWQELQDQEALVILPGPHDYISPSWYENPGVPTWNYQAVHVYGQCRVFEDAEALRELVNGLTAKHEAGFEQPWQPQYKEAMLKAIVGIEISIGEIQCKYKLSQNRALADREGAIAKLEKQGAAALTAAMRKTLL